MSRKHEGPTVMTSALLSPEHVLLPNREIVDRISRFMDDLDVDALVVSAIRDACQQFITTGAWRPGLFTCAITGVSGGDLVARPPNDSDLRKSIRIPGILLRQVKQAATLLGCTNGVIIRAALDGGGLAAEMSKKLPALDADDLGAARRRSLLDAD